MYAPSRVLGSRRRPVSWRRSSKRCVRLFGPSSSAISACRSAASTWPTRTPERSGPKTATPCDVANSLLLTLSGSGQVEPNFWLNPENGVSYPIVAQTRCGNTESTASRACQISRSRPRMEKQAYWTRRLFLHPIPATHQRFLVCCRTGEPVTQEKCLCLTPTPKMFSPN